MKTKIVIISELSGGGVEKVNTTIAAHINKDKYDVTILSMVSNKESYAQWDFPFNVVFLQKKSKKYAMFATIQQLKLLEPDIILTCGFIETYFAFICRTVVSKKVKIVYALHSVFSYMDKSTAKKKFLIDKLPLLVGLYKKIDAIIFVSNGVKEDFENHCCNLVRKEYVIYNPIVDSNSQYFRYKNLNYSHIKLVTAGRIEYEKNQELLIRVVSKLKKNGYSVELHILGEGSLKHKLVDLSKTLGIESNIVFDGFRKNIFNELSRGDIFLLSSRYESFGNVIVEAMNVGLPVISTDCQCGPCEILNYGEFGILVSLDDEQAMYNAILKTMELHSEQRAISSYKRSVEFSIQKSVNRYEKMFDEIFGGGLT